MAPNDSKDGQSQPASPLRILLVEDNADDAWLCLRVLEKCPFKGQFDVVKTRTEFIDQIHSTSYDIVLSDYALGTWTGEDAFSLLRQENNNIPFILVTGALGEVKAVECVKNGMADYILKDHLDRLPFAISRALEEKSLRDNHRQAEELLRESEEKFRTLAESIPAAIFIEQGNHCCYVNRASEVTTGYSRKELLAMSFSQLIHPDFRDAVIEHQAKRLEGDVSASRYELMVLGKQKEEARWLDVATGMFELNGQPATLITALDITERKRTESDTLSLRDPLTGVGSRQRLLQVFDSEATRTDRTGRPFSLLFLVLDGVKRIASKNGQLVASRALCRFARTMELHCRKLDTLARIGADGFAFILPETGAEGAAVLGRRIAHRIANDPEEPKLSCDFETTTYPQDGKTFDDLINMADRQVRRGNTGGDGKSLAPSQSIT